ncbi:MAG: CDP-alcohol phosphatidyltransferase family protein [Acidobacteriota bacterium]|nr:CDP-alcohol phosphatidyltransferase family protein [Acidobacteriota bacterium]
MTRKAIILVDADRMLDGTPLSLVKISGVPLLTRIILDARRAEVSKVVVVLTRPHAQIEEGLREKKLSIMPVSMSETGWQTDALQGHDDSAILLTADRLYDFGLLSALRAARLNGDRAIISVDFKPPDAPPAAERRYTIYDGQLIGNETALAAEDFGRDTGAYVFNRQTLERVFKLTAEERSKYVRSLVGRNEAARFDIGNGFVQPIETRQDVRHAGNRIIRYIWKETDGIHARWNKKVALPFIKLLLHTPVTPNMISVGGVFVSLAAGYSFFQGGYFYSVVGAILSYVSALFDHVDGSIARLKSMESAFGCYFEQGCDFIFYFSFAVGLTGGLYGATGNPIYLTLGGALLFGTLVSFFTLSYQRKEFAKNPSQLAGQAHRTFEANKQNPIYRFGRTTYFVIKRPVLPYYLFILTVLGALPLVLFVAALGANLFWMIQLYSNRLFRSSAKASVSSWRES